MGDGSYVHQVVLRKPEEFTPGDRPTVSLSLTVRSGDSRAGELLDAVGAWVDEVVIVAVDVGREVVASLEGHRVFRDKPCTVVVVDPGEFPGLYLRDVPETYSVGRPLDGEVYAGSSTGRYLVADWSRVRNLGLARCTQEWRLVLDGDDVLFEPTYVASVCDVLGRFGRDLGYSRYVRPVGELAGVVHNSTIVGRVVENSSRVRWEGVARESLDGYHRPAVLEGSLVAVRTTTLARTADDEVDDFKILYANARRREWQVPPCDLLYMVRAARHVGMEDFAEEAFSAYLRASLYTEERAWACALKGEICEIRGDYESASSWYERSLAEHPGYKSAFRLCRSRFLQREWQACLDAYDRGVVGGGFVHMVDDGACDARTSLVFVVAALAELGRRQEARERGEILRRLFPSAEGVFRLCEGL